MKTLHKVLAVVLLGMIAAPVVSKVKPKADKKAVKAYTGTQRSK